jgi:hypothetical protein
MKKFKVAVEQSSIWEMEVEAENEEQAQEIIEQAMTGDHEKYSMDDLVENLDTYLWEFRRAEEIK